MLVDNFLVMNCFDLCNKITKFQVKIFILYCITYNVENKKQSYDCSCKLPGKVGETVNDLKYRHELKYLINYHDRMILSGRFRHTLKRDMNAGPDGSYAIRSIYFDNTDDRALFEKIYGINYREKFRIRCYNGSASVIKLEKKMKANGLTAKLSSELSIDQCRAILNNNIEFLRDSEDEVMNSLYIKMKNGLYRPKCIVDYKREAFVYSPGNVRLTFDSELRSGLNSVDFFNSELPSIRVLPEGFSVLEVKFDEFLPDVVSDIIQTNNRRLESVSKYASCRMIANM